MRLKTYKMAMSILPKFLNLKWNILRTIWRIEVGDGSFFCIFHALLFELNVLFDRRFPLSSITHAKNSNFTLFKGKMSKCFLFLPITRAILYFTYYLGHTCIPGLDWEFPPHKFETISSKDVSGDKFQAKTHALQQISYFTPSSSLMLLESQYKEISNNVYFCTCEK